MFILFKIDNGQDQNSVFKSVLYQLKEVPADYHPKHLRHQLTKSLIVMRESLKVSLFFCKYFILLPQTLFHKNFYSVHSVLTKHYFTKTLQCALCTYQTLFHKNLYNVHSVLTKHYFTKTFTMCTLYVPNIISQKTFTVCTLYLPNIISQKLLQCALCTYQTLFHKNIILNKNIFIRESWLSNLSPMGTPMGRWLNRCLMKHKQHHTLTLCQQL